MGEENGSRMAEAEDESWVGTQRGVNNKFGWEGLIDGGSSEDVGQEVGGRREGSNGIIDPRISKCGVMQRLAQALHLLVVSTYVHPKTRVKGPLSHRHVLCWEGGCQSRKERKGRSGLKELKALAILNIKTTI